MYVLSPAADIVLMLESLEYETRIHNLYESYSLLDFAVATNSLIHGSHAAQAQALANSWLFHKCSGKTSFLADRILKLNKKDGTTNGCKNM